MNLQRVATGAAVVTLAVAVGGVAVAASDRSSTSSAFGNLATEDGATIESGPGQRHRLGPPGGPGMHGAIHGEYVVPDGDSDGDSDGDGAYQTIATQRGTVQEVSNDSLKVKSEDGYTKTYVVTAETLVNAQRDGIDSIDKDDEVSVMATVEDGTATIVRVDDVTAMREHPFFERRAELRRELAPTDQSA